MSKSLARLTFAVAVVAAAPAVAQDVVTIGFTASKAGALAGDSLAQVRGFELWRDEVNAAGGLRAGARRIKVEFNHGMHMWARAKGSLDQISDSDLALVEALEACLEYAHKRLTESRNGKVGGE